MLILRLDGVFISRIRHSFAILHELGSGVGFSGILEVFDLMIGLEFFGCNMALSVGDG